MAHDFVERNAEVLCRGSYLLLDPRASSQDVVVPPLRVPIFRLGHRATIMRFRSLFLSVSFALIADIFSMSKLILHLALLGTRLAAMRA